MTQIRTNIPVLHVEDISAQVFGRYQFCTQAKDGMWYADCDFTLGNGFGEPKKGALPSPRQDTAELTARARAMHERAALLHRDEDDNNSGARFFRGVFVGAPFALALWIMIFLAVCATP